MLVADLTQYAVHRTFHSVGWLWPFHAIHHSSRTLDWLAGSRLHVVNIIVTRALILVPLFALGFSQMALYIWLVIVAVQATLNHVNIRFDVPILNQFVRPAALSSLAPCDEAGGQELRRTLPLDRSAVRHLSHAQRGVAARKRAPRTTVSRPSSRDSSSGHFDAATTDRTGLSIDGLSANGERPRVRDRAPTAARRPSRSGSAPAPGAAATPSRCRSARDARDTSRAIASSVR